MATAKQTKRAPAKGSSTYENNKKRARRQIAAVITFAAAVFLLFLVFIRGQNVWSIMHNFLFGLFGVCTYIWPFLLGYVAIMTALDKPIGKTGTKVWQSAVLIVLICAAVDIVRASGIDASFGEYIVSAYNTGVGNVGGGFFGALVGWPIYHLFGRTGAIITIILLIFIFFMLVTGMTLIMFFKYITRPVTSTAKSAEEAYMRHVQEMEEEAEDEVPQKARFNIDVPLGDEDGKAKSSAKKSAGKLKISDKVSSIEEQENEALERQTEIIKSHAQSIGEKADSGMTPPPKTIEEIIEGSDKSNTEEKPPFEVPEGAGVVMEKEGSHYRMPPVTPVSYTHLLRKYNLPKWQIEF